LTIVLGVNLLRTAGKYRPETAIRQHITSAEDEMGDAQWMRLTFADLRRERLQVTAAVVTPAPCAGDLVPEIAELSQSRSYEADAKVLGILSANFRPNY
jgi:hypothetical protein